MQHMTVSHTFLLPLMMGSQCLYQAHVPLNTSIVRAGSGCSGRQA